MTVFSVDNLSVSLRGRELVSDVSFSINKAEIFALVGESGSGKTLTALSVMDLLPPELHKRVTNETPKQKHFRGKQISMVFQEPMTSLNPLHTIGRQISEAIEIHQPLLAKAAVRARVLELLSAVGLSSFSERLDAYPHQLSGGERQRVMIAMAIANDPALLVADEPTTALDVTVQAQILALLISLKKRLGMSVLLITHDLSIVKRVADRVAIMSQGKIVESGLTAEVFRNPSHAYTRKLLAAVPSAMRREFDGHAPVLMECKDLQVGFVERGGFFAWKKTYKQVLEHVTLQVMEGSTLGIVGESGSGKSTLALALLQLLGSKGEVCFGGDRIDTLSGSALRARRRDMQIVFQDPYSSLNPRMRVGDIIREGLDVHEADTSLQEREAKVETILAEVGLLPEMKHRYPHEFSGGQRQRISIARALVLQPKLIILDEPTSALDISVQAQILDLLIGLQNKYGMSYIFISHDLRTIRAISHRIMVLQKGAVVESGSTAEIFANPKERYTRVLLAAAF
ncbi:MAG TPA: dipeptide ABC transporter ATP-binding protein [Rickettsiales bacterium]|nr:dipeptide ABC transporter ATP-binding protein [Rickettsiales bacterium]